MTDAEEPVAAAGDAVAVGAWDVLLLVAFVGFIVYWFFLRPKKDPNAEVRDFQRKKRSTSSTTTDSSGTFIDRMIRKDFKVAIFYGSQTGTAEDFSARLMKDLRRMGLPCTMLDPEDHEMDELTRLKEIEDSLVLFVVATYGEGDPTDNARPMFDWLSETDADLSGTRFAVFSLGNKTYEHYNSMGRLVDKKLEQLGAERFFRRGEGDDDGNIEEDFVKWREDFLVHVRERFNITGEQAGQLREYELEVHDPPPAHVFQGEPTRLKTFERQRSPFNPKNPFLAPITIHKELHQPKSDRSCMHVELGIADSKLKYASGDHVAIQPRNNSEMVESIGQRLNVNLATVISLNASEDASPGKANPFPCPCSYRTALTHYIDISSRPRTNVLESLIEYCTTDEDKQVLRSVTAPGDVGRAEYNRFVVASGRNLLDVLEALPSLMPPLDLLLEMLPRLQVRYFSISSSPKMFPDSIHVTASTHHYTTPTGREGSGVATSWIESLRSRVGNNDARIPIYIRKSTLRLPLRPVIPVIMVGPGTGLAPFRAFVQERHLLKQDGKLVGETRLYFGCRNRDTDYIYEEELKSYADSGSLALRVAFSRDQGHKVYVSDLLLEDAEHIWSLISKDNAHFYVCGDAKRMAKDVNAMLHKIAMEQGEKTAEEAEAFIKSMKTRGRYIVDAWS